MDLPVNIPANTPRRFRPEALDPFVPFLKKYQDSHPNPQFLRHPGKSPDALRIALRSAVRGWLKYGWDVPSLGFVWWQETWPNLRISQTIEHVVLCPRDYAGKFNELDAMPVEFSQSQAEQVHHHFTSTPPQSIFIAFATLFSAELLDGEVRFSEPVPKEWLEPFDNIEFFQPADKPYFVLV